MQRWGHGRKGRQRFRCLACGRSGQRRRTDQQARAWRPVFLRWLVRGGSLQEVAAAHGVSVRSVQRRFRPLWEERPAPLPCETPVEALTGVMKRERVVLVVEDAYRREPIGWAFAARESYVSWYACLHALKGQGIAPRFAVCDGHRGLGKALRELWPEIRVQRCLAHVIREAKARLTQHPQSEAARDLLHLVRQLPGIRTKRQRRRWLRSWRQWLRRYDGFLKERTANPDVPRRWWYTHRKLRSVRALLAHSVEDLFLYTRYPQIPRTTNAVEGGINSRLKDLYRRHRGLSLERKTTLAAWYLRSRQHPRKPTQNVH